MNKRKVFETPDLLKELFSIGSKNANLSEKQTIRSDNEEVVDHKLLKKYFDVNDTKLQPKNSRPFFGAITPEMKEDFLGKERRNARSEELQKFFSEIGYTLTLRNAELSDVKRYLEEVKFEGDYKFATKRNAVRVLHKSAKKMSDADVKGEIDRFLAILLGEEDLQKIKSRTEEAKTNYAGEEYSQKYESYKVLNAEIPGYAPTTFVVTFALGSGSSLEKESIQTNSLRTSLEKFLASKPDDRNIYAKVGQSRKMLGTFNEVTDPSSIGAEDAKSVKADIIFKGPRGDMYVSLKDGKSAKGHQQWGGILRDAKIRESKVTLEFVKEALNTCSMSLKEIGGEQIIQLSIPNTKWAVVDDPMIKIRALYGPDAAPPGTENPQFGLEFCNVVLQCKASETTISSDGTLNPGGKTFVWPAMPTDSSDPVYYMRRDNRSNVKIPAEWRSDIAEIVSKKIGDKSIIQKIESREIDKIAGARFLIWPKGKLSTDELKHQITLTVGDSSGAVSEAISLMKELLRSW
jgi:hypothetical protein